MAASGNLLQRGVLEYGVCAASIPAGGGGGLVSQTGHLGRKNWCQVGRLGAGKEWGMVSG